MLKYPENKIKGNAKCPWEMVNFDPQDKETTKIKITMIQRSKEA